MLITLNVFSQRIEVNKIDDFTKSHIIKTNMLESTNPNRVIFKKSDYIDITNELLFSMSYYKSSDTTEVYYMSVMFTVDLGCLSQYDGKMMVILDDNTVLTFMQFSNTDCSSVLRADYYLLNREDSDKPIWRETMADNILKLLSHKVFKIRIYGSKYYNDFILKPEKQNIISSHLNIINGVKDIK